MEISCDPVFHGICKISSIYPFVKPAQKPNLMLLPDLGLVCIKFGKIFLKTHLYEDHLVGTFIYFCYQCMCSLAKYMIGFFFLFVHIAEIRPHWFSESLFKGDFTLMV